MPPESTTSPKLCECGCGEVVTTGSRFRQGHNNRLLRIERVLRQCEYCGNDFLANPYFVARGGARFCSKRCGYLGHVPPLIDRFWAKVDRSDPDGCWTWQGAKGNFGYGHFAINGVSMNAHRASYILNVGPIPEGFFVLHKCDNPPCIRPDHLYCGTPADNNRDMVERRRTTKGRPMPPEAIAKMRRGDDHWTHQNPERLLRGDENTSRTMPERMPRGENHPNARLTEDKVREIRRLHADGVSGHKLAAMFGVCLMTISLVVRRKGWTHVL